jgi:hypothetical protein
MDIPVIHCSGERRIGPPGSKGRYHIHVPAQEKSGAGPVRDQVAHTTGIFGNGRPDTQPIKKNPDVLDDLLRPPGGILAPDFYQV